MRHELTDKASRPTAGNVSVTCGTSSWRSMTDSLTHLLQARIVINTCYDAHHHMPAADAQQQSTTQCTRSSAQPAGCTHKAGLTPRPDTSSVQLKQAEQQRAEQTHSELCSRAGVHTSLEHLTGSRNAPAFTSQATTQCSITQGITCSVIQAQIMLGDANDECKHAAGPGPGPQSLGTAKSPTFNHWQSAGNTRHCANRVARYTPLTSNTQHSS